MPTQSSVLRVPRPLRATHKWSVTAAAEPGKSPQAVRLGRRPRCISKNQPSATPRRRADWGRPKRKIEVVGRGCPGGTRRRTRSRASGGGPRETHGAAPPANARQPSQPAGCPAFPACPQELLGFVRSRCPFAGTASFISQSRLRRFPMFPFATTRTPPLKLDRCQRGNLLPRMNRPRRVAADVRRRIHALRAVHPPPHVGGYGGYQLSRLSPPVVAADRPSEELTRRQPPPA